MNMIMMEWHGDTFEILIFFSFVVGGVADFDVSMSTERMLGALIPVACSVAV